MTHYRQHPVTIHQTPKNITEAQQQEEDNYAADFTAQERSIGAHSAIL
jgi:hypothetical protein